MTWWQNLDFTVFHLINTTWSNRVFDILLPLWREKLIWAPFYLFVLTFILENFSKPKRLVILFGLALTVGLADFTSSTIVKKNVQRLRPCNDPAVREWVVQRVPCGSGFSFTSSHAANHFALAVYLGIFLGGIAKWVRPSLFCWAFLVAYSQVYVGVHYPADIIVGALLGAFIACLIGFFVKKWTFSPV